MARKPADKSIPPPLRALGGWPDAEWFDPAILEAGEVVGFSLPALPGSRKQAFELDERSAGAAGPRKQPIGKAAPARAPAGIGQILDDLGTIRAASFRRPRFFFDASPTLYFATVPATHLKARAADALRRNLIATAHRGCILSWQAKEAMAMFWPSTEVEVTNFVCAAAPPHPLHAQFAVADDERRLAQPAKRGGAGRAQAAPDTAERQRLLAELDGMRGRIAELERLHSMEGALETLGLTDTRLKAMLLLLHPDKHGNSEAANEAAKWVNGLREVLRGKK